MTKRSKKLTNKEFICNIFDNLIGSIDPQTVDVEDGGCAATESGRSWDSRATQTIGLDHRGRS